MSVQVVVYLNSYLGVIGEQQCFGIVSLFYGVGYREGEIFMVFFMCSGEFFFLFGFNVLCGCNKFEFYIRFIVYCFCFFFLSFDGG